MAQARALEQAAEGPLVGIPIQIGQLDAGRPITRRSLPDLPGNPAQRLCPRLDEFLPLFQIESLELIRVLGSLGRALRELQELLAEVICIILRPGLPILADSICGAMAFHALTDRSRKRITTS